MLGPVAKAMLIIRRPSDGALLVSRNFDGDGSGYERPLGGHIEFGERSEESVRRELQEEIGQAVQNVRLRGVFENLFTHRGEQGHEIVFVFEADFVDPAAYEVEEQVILDDMTGRVRVRWRQLEESSPRLVPTGIEHFTHQDGSAPR